MRLLLFNAEVYQLHTNLSCWITEWVTQDALFSLFGMIDLTPNREAGHPPNPKPLALIHF